MIKKLIFMLLILLLVINVNCLVLAQDSLALVISSISLDVNEGGKLVPEIAVNSDGSWRKATLKDVWSGQGFDIFDTTKYPILRGRVTVNSLNGDYYVGCDAKNNINRSSHYWGIYKIKQQFHYVYRGEAMKSKYVVNGTTQKALLDKGKGIKAQLQNVIKLDWKNIKKEFPKLPTSNLFDFMVGDVNGDHKTDYIIILSDLQHMKGEAVFVYVSIGKYYSMIPIRYREYKNTYCWFMLDCMMDFNGDGMKEFMVDSEDGDTCYPTVYGWNKDKQGLMTLYTGEELYTW
jgi:hypothetical protein